MNTASVHDLLRMARENPQRVYQVVGGRFGDVPQVDNGDGRMHFFEHRGHTYLTVSGEADFRMARELKDRLASLEEIHLSIRKTMNLLKERVRES